MLRTLSLVLLLVSLGANVGCASHSTQSIYRAKSVQKNQPQLNSERIEQKFGSYGIDVIYAQDQTRISDLYSVNDNHKTTQTLAIVSFLPIDNNNILSIHRQVLAGASLGAAFKSAGWQINKKSQALFNIEPHEALTNIYQKMGLTHSASLATHVYELSVEKQRTHPYAIITEIHSPAFQRLNELEFRLGIKSVEADPAQMNHILEAIQKVTAK